MEVFVISGLLLQLGVLLWGCDCEYRVVCSVIATGL